MLQNRALQSMREVLADISHSNNYTKPDAPSWEDVKKIAELHRIGWNDPAFIFDLSNPIHEAYVRRLRNDHFLMAIHLCPKMKGWAWHKKTGFPKSFAEQSAITNFLRWSANSAGRDMWHELATDKWNHEKQEGLTWEKAFLFVCLAHSEGSLSTRRYCESVVSLIGDMIRENRRLKLAPLLQTT